MGLRFRFLADTLPLLTLRREKKFTLRRRSAFEEDGEEQREEPRNGIDLDINPGRLPPPPEPRGRAAPSLGSGCARAPGSPGFSGPREQARGSLRARAAKGASHRLPRSYPAPGARRQALRRTGGSALAQLPRGQQVSPESGAPPASLLNPGRRTSSESSILRSSQTTCARPGQARRWI